MAKNIYKEAVEDEDFEPQEETLFDPSNPNENVDLPNWKTHSLYKAIEVQIQALGTKMGDQVASTIERKTRQIITVMMGVKDYEGSEDDADEFFDIATTLQEVFLDAFEEQSMLPFLPESLN